MSRTNPKGVPISQDFNDLTPPPMDVEVPEWTKSNVNRLHERMSKAEVNHAKLEAHHSALERDLADVKLASNEQQRSLAKIELGMVGIQTTMAHISSEMARSNQRADNGGQNVANWIRFSIQIILTIAAVLVAVYAASKK